MATEITMPKLSDTMTDGRFIGWSKNVGDRIERGDVIAEVETDKAVMELEAFTAGVLLKTFATGGETVPVGTVLGLIGEAGEAATVSSVETAPPAETPAAPVEPAPAPPEPPAPVQEAPKEQTPEPATPLATAETAAPAAHEAATEKASPLVRRLAREMGIDLASVSGSGPEGRILQQDLTAFVAARNIEVPAPSSASRGMTPTPVAAAAGEAPPATPSGMRQAIAATVARSWQEIPHFTVTVEIDMRACREIVHELKGTEDELGYNALVVKASALTLARFPRLLAGGTAAAGIHIGFAVALPDGLLVPVLRNCERLPLPELAREASRLAQKARTGKLGQDDLSGALFTISNLGMYGVDEFMALIMPGQAAILAVGAVLERPAYLDGQIVPAPLLRVTLSSDHRVVDGAYAAAFLSEMRHYLEQPLRMFL